MSWFKRLKDGVQTATKHKKEAPDGVWYKCKSCGDTSTTKELKENFYKCTVSSTPAILPFVNV